MPRAIPFAVYLRRRIPKQLFHPKTIFPQSASHSISSPFFLRTALLEDFFTSIRKLGLDWRIAGDGARLQQYDWLGQANQEWQIVQLPNGNNKIVNYQSGLVLDVLNGSLANGAPVQQYEFLDNEESPLP